MRYTPGPGQPDDLTELWRYLQRELGKIRRVLDTLETVVPVYHEPPRQPRAGLLVIADGTDWDPGSGRGLYIWSGSAWEQVKVLGNP